jgi:flagellar M-ring protein FliF
MGESVIGGTSDARRLIIISVIVVAFSSLFLLVFSRSCGIKDPNAGYTTVYSNLDLRDAANVVTQLKALKIPYQIRDEGRSIAVQKDKADDARLGLAEKNLPTGGVVGWEIFDQSKLGATDFDRQVEFIRAISGELSRTIDRIDAVEDCRIQIVIPKTELFAAAKAPVTASVLLQLKSGRTLTNQQVSGIVHLVASSVENLRPENVTIVDIFGNILNGNKTGESEYPAEEGAAALPEAVPTKEALEIMRSVPAKEAPPAVTSSTAESGAAAPAGNAPLVSTAAPKIQKIEIPKAKPVTPEDIALLRLKAKDEYENRLSSKIQLLVNNFYPPNSILVKVNVDLDGKSADKAENKAVKNGFRKRHCENKHKKPEAAKTVFNAGKITPAQVKKITVIVLIDNRFNLTGSLKKTTYETVTNAISFNRARGDKIVIRKVPFHYASEFDINKPLQPGSLRQTGGLGLSKYYKNKKVLIGSASLLAFLVLLLAVRRGRKAKSVEQAQENAVQQPQDTNKRFAAIDALRGSVAQSPEKIAELLKKWLSEEKGEE